MAHRRVKADLVSYGALICCLCRTGKSHKAESLMEEMLKSGILPDAQICRALIHCYCKQLDIDKVELLLSFFAKEFKIFYTESYSCLVGIFTEAGNIDK